MKFNSHVIFLIAIVGIITAGVVGATILNNGSMKQVDFDGTKVSVPSDSNFVKTGDGYADSKYGITIHLFKDKGSMVNFLKNQPGMSAISLKNQPPQSFAFTKGEDTNIFVASDVEAISIGAKDQGLVSDMANSVVFSNHQKSAKPDPIFPVIFAPPYLDIDNDFYFIKELSNEVNTDVFNNVTVSNTLNQIIFEHNGAIDNNTYSQYTAKEFAPNSASSNSNNNQQNTSLLDNQNVANVVNSISPDNPSNDNSAGGDSGSVSSGSSSGNSPTTTNKDSGASSGSSSSSSSGGAPAKNNQQQKITQSQLKTDIEKKLPSGYSISKIVDKNGFYSVSIKDSKGKIHEYKYDYSGRQIK